LRDAVSLRKLQEAFANGDWYQYLIPAAEALGDWYTVELSVEQVDEVRHGHRVPALEEVEPGKWARAVSQEGELVALDGIRQRGARMAAPQSVFPLD
jgi:tRNA Pseudouridine synthase II, C terminal.